MARRKRLFKRRKITQKFLISLVVFLTVYLIGTILFPKQMQTLYKSMGIRNGVMYSYDLDNIPEYDGDGYVYINDNKPFFRDDEITTDTFELYSDLDMLGRCGVAYANLSKDLMPDKERESIGMVKPSGWHTVKYNGVVDGNYLYNRCHLIGFQLAGENANPKNLITCTRQMNTTSMLEFENLVADYIKRTNNHVLYRVTPMFKDSDLVAYGVLMEGYSVEDNGRGIKFNVFVYNVQDKIEIDYHTGNSKLKK